MNDEVGFDELGNELNDEGNDVKGEVPEIKDDVVNGREGDEEFCSVAGDKLGI